MIESIKDLLQKEAQAVLNIPVTDAYEKAVDLIISQTVHVGSFEQSFIIRRYGVSRMVVGKDKDYVRPLRLLLRCLRIRMRKRKQPCSTQGNLSYFVHEYFF